MINNRSRYTIADFCLVLNIAEREEYDQNMVRMMFDQTFQLAVEVVQLNHPLIVTYCLMKSMNVVYSNIFDLFWSLRVIQQ
jgi:fatty-acid desaturase